MNNINKPNNILYHQEEIKKILSNTNSYNEITEYYNKINSIETKKNLLKKPALNES